MRQQISSSFYSKIRSFVYRAEQYFDKNVNIPYKIQKRIINSICFI